MNFEDRLRKAIQRGQHRGDANSKQARLKELSEDELRILHGDLRLKLSEHIETCLRGLPGHFPGFQYQTIFGERGWGAACSRDDIRMVRGRRENDYSRIEMTVRPYSNLHVLELAAKSTIRNKELFNRSHFAKIEDVDLPQFTEFVDLWVLEYAEMYAARV